MPSPQDTERPEGRRRHQAPFGDWGGAIAHDTVDGGELKAPVRSVFTDVKACATRLADATGWSLEQLLDKAGCTASRRKDPEELGNEQLERCQAFLGWIGEVALALDTVPERRLVVSGAARLLKLAGKEVNPGEDVGLFLSVTAAGDPHCGELLELGELGFAWQEARRHLPGAAGDRARRLRLGSPYSIGAPHLAEQRVELLVGAPGRLGDRTAERMRRHLASCEACAAAYPGVAAGPLGAF